MIMPHCIRNTGIFLRLTLCSCRLKLNFVLVSHNVSTVIQESDYNMYAEMGCYNL